MKILFTVFLGYTGLTVGLAKEFNTFYILVWNMTLLILKCSEKLPADTGLRVLIKRGIMYIKLSVLY